MLPINTAEYDVIIDALEDRCPMPLLKTKMALNKMRAGDRLCIIASDSGSTKDIPKYLDISGHILEESTQTDGVFRFLIRKGDI